MKNLYVLAAIAGLSALVACGSSKKAASSDYQYQQWLAQQQQQQQQQEPKKSSLGIVKEKSEIQLYAEDPTATSLRAWALYNGFADDNLESAAATSARGELANMISVLVSNAIENYNSRYNKQGNSNGEIQKRLTLDAKSESEIKAVAKELIAGSRIVKTKRYIQKDGTETAYVCVEIDPEIIAENIRKNGALQEAINENEKLKIDFKSQQFDKSMEKSFEELKVAKQNQ